MTVQNNLNKHIYIGDGEITEFPYTFILHDESHMKVYVVDLEGNETLLEGNYEVDMYHHKVIYPLSGDPLPPGHKLILYREVPVTQEMDLTNQGALPNETLERAYDKLTLIAQQHDEAIKRSLKVALTYPGTVFDWPMPAPGKAVGWNEDGTRMVNYDNPGEASAKARAEADRARAEANRARAEADRAQEEADRAKWAADAVGDATYKATPNTLIRRDANGRAKVAAPVEADDIARKADLEALLEALYPIGTVYENAITSANPATYLGFGTWEPFGQGRVTVGVDASQSEFNSVQKTGGAKTHTLTIGEMPSHTHQYRQYKSGDEWGQSPGNWDNRGFVTWTTEATGGGQPHNNLQPYITVYRWLRTA